jgi:DNA replication and repair protein RecF
VLRQRNILLRQAGGRPDADEISTLEVWDQQLGELGEELIAARRKLVADLETPTRDAFCRLTGTTGALTLEYRPSFEGRLLDALDAARNEDLRRGITTKGPHRDDLALAYDDLDARTRLSQGRQRAATLALRLAAHEVIASVTGATPILLLDDAFSELDVTTADALAGELPAGQAILTTAGTLPSAIPVSVVRHLADGAFQ